jgi:nucleotide-binding universal stress UspA family protein
MKIKKILLPIDYSECSLNALAYAGQVAEKFNGKLVLMYAMDNENIATPKMIKEGKNENIKKISKIIDKDPHVINIMTDILISEKSPKDAILWAADTFDIDLIIMGTEGVRDPFDELAGTFTYVIISKSQIPVLTVPVGCEFTPYKKIGFGVDYKPIEHTPALDILLDFVYTFESKLEIFHVQKYSENKELVAVHESSKLDHYFSEVDHEFQTVKNSSPAEGLNDYMIKHHPDLLVIMPRKYKFFDWLKHTSVSREIVQHAQLPILTFPDK